MIPVVFVILLIAGLCVARFVASKIPHRPSPKEVQVVREALSVDAYKSLFDVGGEEEFTGWNVVRTDQDEWNRRRQEK